MQSDAKTVPAYLKAVPEADRRKALTTLRGMIRKAAPEATETMQYGMPTYDLNGFLFALAAQKNYLALYVTEHAVVEQFKPRLGKVNCGKSCIRFARLDAIDVGAVGELLTAAAAARRAAG